jgi:CubicO group peptidase (beta-lactamase class C family)
LSKKLYLALYLFFIKLLADHKGINVMRRLVLPVIFLTFSIRIMLGQTGTPVPALKSVDSLTKLFMEKWHIPGGEIAITRHGKLIYNRGFGYADTLNKTPVQPDNLFRIASCSKPITAVAIMKLYENGKLNLDEIVFGTKGILNNAEFKHIRDKRVEKITIRMLLQHTAGWDREKSGDPIFTPGKVADVFISIPPPDQTTIISYMLKYKKLDFEPGTKFAYSNFGYLLH